MNHPPPPPPQLMNLSITWGCSVSNHTLLQPTRITDHTATLIDNIYFNSNEHYCIGGNLVCDISYHLPNFLFINKLSCSSSKQTIYSRDYSNFDEKKLIEDVQSFYIFESFHIKLSEIIDN